MAISDRLKLHTSLFSGPPPPPNPTFKISQELITIRWDPVFTWPGYPVTGNEIKLLRFSGEQLLHQTINNNINELNVALQMVQGFIDQVGECEELILFVRLINSVGTGEPGRITGGLPKQDGTIH